MFRFCQSDAGSEARALARRNLEITKSPMCRGTFTSTLEGQGDLRKVDVRTCAN